MAGNPECRHEEAGRKNTMLPSRRSLWLRRLRKERCPSLAYRKKNRCWNAVKAASIILTAEETTEVERIADSLELNVIRFWEKEMK